jgi:crotonobetainyl-CoA:carnitine CoA-transferase CaiB-like acyl-CoA transferase
MKTSLAGIRVIELSTMITGPLTGMMLADFGADVIKIENPDGGDPFRSFRGGLYSPHYCAYNRNKRSVTLDLRSDQGNEALKRLIERSDIILNNFRPGVLERLGFGDEFLQETNPRIIRCSISGFGSTGPYAERPAYDAVAQALSGMSSLFVDPQNPKISGPTIIDNATGLFACQGILAALLERERTGKARRIDVNMLDTAIAFMPDPFGYLTQMNVVSDLYLRARTSQSYAFRCADEKLIAIHLSSQEKFWLQFTETIERPDLLQDKRFSTRTLRIDNYDALSSAVCETFLCHSREYWIEQFSPKDVPFAPVYTIDEVIKDPQVQHLGSFFDLHHPTEGGLKAIRRPIWFDGSRNDQPTQAPPTLGEHTIEVLEELGLEVRAHHAVANATAAGA